MNELLDIVIRLTINHALIANSLLEARKRHPLAYAPNGACATSGARSRKRHGEIEAAYHPLMR